MSLAVALILAAATIETLPKLDARESEVNDSSEPVDKNEPPVCTADKRYCFGFVDALESGTQLNLTGAGVADGPHALTTIPRDRNETLALWPQLVRFPATSDFGEKTGEALIFGVETRISSMYSGGGASATLLRLFRADFSYGGRPIAHEILSMPISANKMIRACFSEDDMDKRRGACHDEYDFDATLTLLPDPAPSETKSPDPVFALSVKATVFPSGVSLDEDSLAHGKLRKADLVKSEDPECTYARTLRYNPATERYEFDRPGPDCSAFTVP